MSTSYALQSGAAPVIAADATQADRPGLFKRILSTVLAARRRQADQEIARYVALNGGVMTDELERAISRRYGNMVGG